MSSPHISAPNLLQELDQFAHISGLVINPQKSMALTSPYPPQMYNRHKHLSLSHGLLPVFHI